MFILSLPLQIVLAWFIFSCMGELLCLNLHSDASCWLISHLPTCVFLDWRTKTHMCAISICGDLTSTAAAYSIKLSWKVAAYCQTQSTMDVGPVESINHPLPHRRKTSDSVRVDDKKKSANTVKTCVMCMFMIANGRRGETSSSETHFMNSRWDIINLCPTSTARGLFCPSKGDMVDIRRCLRVQSGKHVWAQTIWMRAFRLRTRPAPWVTWFE